MRLNIFSLGVCMALIFGCSSQQKKQSDMASSAPTQQVTTAAQVGQPGASAKAELQKKDELACKRDQETRTLKLEGSQPKGCKLFYSNHSSKDPVAWSDVAKTHCEQVRDRIRGKLEEAGFKCSVEQTQSSSVQTATQTQAPKPKN